MNRYTKFIDLSEQLRHAVSQMEEATDTKEIETLQLEVRETMRGLMMVVPFIESEIGQYALQNTQRINTANVKG